MTKTSANRIIALDGLRGFAALVVVLHHVLLVDNWFADSLGRYDSNTFDSWKEIIYYTPLHALFAGTEAVLVFFMLSGIVLVKAFPGWASVKISYFVSRLTRLYLPIWGSILFALLLTFARPERIPAGANWWLKGNYNTITGEGVLTNADEALTLVSESALLYNFTDLYSFWLNSSLWSMKIEIVASLILVVFVLGSKRPVLFLGAFIAVVTLVDLDPVARQYLQFLMFFAAGAWLAVSKFRPGRLLANALVLFALFAFTMPWVLRGWDHEWASANLELYAGLVGAISLGFGVLGDSGFRKFLETKPLQYLGSRSYSIYLVHAPIVTLGGFWVLNLTGSIVSWFWYAPLVVIAAVLLGDIFHRVVERPSLRLSRVIRQRLSANSEEAQGTSTS